MQNRTEAEKEQIEINRKAYAEYHNSLLKRFQPENKQTLRGEPLRKISLEELQ